MKKVIYSGLAIATAIAGIAASKANSNHRADNFFKYIGPTSAATPSTAITTLSNWTLTTSATVNACAGATIACGVDASSTNIQNVTLAGQARHIPLKVYRSGKQAVASGSGSQQVLVAFNKD